MAMPNNFTEYGEPGYMDPSPPAPGKPPSTESGQPANPTAPAPPGSPQAGQQAAGVQDWDDPWERRARKLLGDKVGSKEDLSDPEHRKWVRRKMRKAQQGQKDKEATAPATEEEVVGEEPDTGPDPIDTPENVPVPQGSADQFKALEADWAMPERRVPGREKGIPGDPEGGGPEDQMETGLWTEQDQARQDAAGGTEGGGGAGEEGLQTGLWSPEDQARALEGTTEAPQPGEQYVTNAGAAPPEYPTANTGTAYAQPTAPWTSTPIQPTYYTGGM